MSQLNQRERASMHLLKQLFDIYNDMPLKIRVELRNCGVAKKIDEIPAVLKLYKAEVRKEIITALNDSGVHTHRGILPYDNESGEQIVL